MTGLLSPSHIAILLVVVLLVFGAKRLPELGRSLGSGMREFKDSVNPDHAGGRARIPAPDGEPVSPHTEPAEPVDAGRR